jgi:hypothetical protein
MGQPPLALAMVMCDEVWTDPNTGKKTILGTFSSLFGTPFPLRLNQLSAYIALTDAQGKMSFAVRIIDVDEERPPVHEMATEIDFLDPLAVVEGTLRFRNVTFPAPGEYRLQLFCADELVIERRLVVLGPDDLKPEEDDDAAAN